MTIATGVGWPNWQVLATSAGEGAKALRGLARIPSSPHAWTAMRKGMTAVSQHWVIVWKES